MKTILRNIIVLTVLSFALSSCAQTKKETVKEVITKEVPKKEATLAMNKDTLDAKITADFDKEIIERKVAVTKEALTTIKETENLLKLVENKSKKKAIKKGKELIGSLELILAKDPTLALIPVDIDYVKEELVTDIAVVRSATEAAKKAMDEGYYRVASDLLKDLRSEMIINTYLIPTATYPSAISAATLMVEEDKFDEAENTLQKLLGTIVIQKTVLPLPVLNAEQMIIEAELIDAKDHKNVDKVINLLKNADYQLQLAEELGYGKRDKDYKTLSTAISELKASVTNKEDSKSKFKNLKTDLKKFKERLFSKKKK
jgi:hypothetical protein